MQGRLLRSMNIKVTFVCVAQVEVLKAKNLSCCFRYSIIAGSGNSFIILWIYKYSLISISNFFTDVLDYIKYLDTDDNAYMHMMQEPIFTANQNSFNEIQDKFEDYIRHIFQLKKKRMNNIYVGRKYTERMKFFTSTWINLFIWRQ